MHRIKKTFWTFFFFSVFVHVLFHFFPSLAEVLYGNVFFSWIPRPIGDCLGRILPIPGIYIVSLALLFLINWMLVRCIRKQGFFKGFFLGILYSLGFLYMLFYWVWGYNYMRPNVSERLVLDNERPSTEWIHQELEEQIEILKDIRPRLDEVYETSTDITDIVIEPECINTATRNTLKKFKYKVSGSPTLRQLKPDGFLLRWSTAGIYWPFSGECNVENGLHRIAKPEIIAHEYAHAYGVTDEGDCNLIAYYACMGSGNDEMIYSATINYFKELLLSTKDDERYLEQLPKQVRADLKEIRQQHRKFPRFSPKWRDRFYDTYLKINQVKEGMASYRNFVVKKYNIDQQEKLVD